MLMVALTTIILALKINRIASHATVKHHRHQQVRSHLSALAKDTAQTINEGCHTRDTLLASMGEAAVSHALLSVLRQLAGAINVMMADIAYPSSSDAFFSDDWQSLSDDESRQRPWYQDAVLMNHAAKPTLQVPYQAPDTQRRRIN